MTNKQKYREFCNTEKDIPIFSKDWWLDCVCGNDNWDVEIVEKGGQIVASLPYYNKQKSIFNIITMPKLTQNLGIYIKYPEKQKYEKRLSYEKEVMSKLIEQLPKCDMFIQNFHYNITNWLPYYWKNFNATIYYTYVIENLNNTDLIWSNFNNKTRTDIRKAEKKVKVITSDDIDLFYKINKMTFDRQNIGIPYSLEYIKGIDNACIKNNCRKIFFAIDEKQQIHAAIYIVWDSNSAYYIMGGGNPNLRSSGATHLLIWEAIKFSSIVVNKFDFEGSIMEKVEKFVRSFGAVQKPYFQITKTNSKLLKLRNFLMDLKK